MEQRCAADGEWFSRAAATAPAYSPPEIRTIKMITWALTFLRARHVYDDMIRTRIWSNPAARAEIGRMLRRNTLLTSTRASMPFGNLSASADQLDPDYVNQRVVSFGATDLDDMAVAMGNFAFRVVVAGGVTPNRHSPRHRVTISEIGIYIRDAYDFNGSQCLGFWDDSDNAVSMANPLSGTAVSNDDFRAWRSANGRGGDFIIYSDVYRLKLTAPDEFDI